MVAANWRGCDMAARFASTVTIGGETHIGLGILEGELVVGATLAGYDVTPDTTAKLVAWLARKLPPPRQP
jgi:hypothetical protein